MRTLIIRDQDNLDHAKAEISRLHLGKQVWEVVIRKHQKKRTTSQNALMWQWYTILGNEFGCTKDEMHDILREKFLPWREVEVAGIRYKILTSTSANEFATVMESEYLNQIDRFAAEQGILLPHPGDDYYDDLAIRF